MKGRSRVPLPCTPRAEEGSQPAPNSQMPMSVVASQHLPSSVSITSHGIIKINKEIEKDSVSSTRAERVRLKMEATPCTGKPNAIALSLGPLLLIPVCSGVWAYISGANKPY